MILQRAGFFSNLCYVWQQQWKS